eukprot:3780225-Amphidinium_carterae.1
MMRAMQKLREHCLRGRCYCRIAASEERICQESSEPAVLEPNAGTIMGSEHSCDELGLGAWKHPTSAWFAVSCQYSYA